MLRQESFSLQASQTGVTHTPSVLSLHPILCTPCLCWLMYLPSIKGRGNFEAVKTNMPEEGWSFGRGWLENCCCPPCPSKHEVLGEELACWQHTDTFWQWVRELCLSEACQRYVKLCLSKLQSARGGEEQGMAPCPMTLLLSATAQWCAEVAVLLWRLTKVEDQVWVIIQWEIMSSMKKMNGDSQSCPEDIIPPVQKLGETDEKHLLSDSEKPGICSAIQHTSELQNSLLQDAEILYGTWINKWGKISRAMKYKERNSDYSSA